MKTFEKHVLKGVFKGWRARFEDVCENDRKRRFGTPFDEFRSAF